MPRSHGDHERLDAGHVHLVEQLEADAQAQCYASSDMVEGLAALTEKRPPVFTNFEGYAEALQR